LSLLVSLIGLLVYALTEGKSSAAGFQAYSWGLLVFLLQAAPHIVGAFR
jgi:hypothetical protein